MADLFKITPAIRNLAQGAIDSMIDQLGKTCRLVFESPQTACPNCFFDVRTRRSSGVYNNTGPQPFTRPPCPVCHGTGMIGAAETYQDVKFLIDRNPKPWQFVDIDVTLPQGLLQTKGYIVDLPKVLQAKYLIVDPDNSKYETNRYRLWGEPMPSGNIVANRYMVCLWVRYGG